MSFPGRGRHTGMSTQTEAEAAITGDRDAFTAIAERHRRELQVHCYRMLGSFDDAEDLVQETFLRAWRSRESYQGRSTFRAWMYRIATNACLDAIAKRPRVPTESAEIPWLQPFPDRLLEDAAPSDAEPDALVVAKETIELAFMVAIQHLPPQSRAVLILRDVLGWPAKDTAELLDTTVAAVNSALQRAHAALKQHLPERRTDWAAGGEPSERERALLQRFVEATERTDAEALAALMREDARFSMPPEPGMWVGREAIVGAWTEGGFGSAEFGDVRCLVTSANRQPAVACYSRRPGESGHRAFALDVLGVHDGAITEIVAFPPTLFAAFELPETL
jgi:RNA polymerase sigma-70 factor, ECF subfamily